MDFKENKLFVEFFQKHFFFIFLFLGYFLSFILFGEFTLFYIDKFDNEIVYNYILGKFYKGDLQAADIFLNGEIEIYWLRRFFQPFSLLYIFGAEIGYWTIDILVKIVSYISFYIFAKKISKNLFISSLCACLFASLNQDSLHGFLIACLPYFTYLVLFKEKLTIKHFLIISFCALNSEIVYSPFFSLFLIVFLLIFNKHKLKNFKNFLIISCIFYFFIIISNSNIIYSFLFDGPFHREEIINETVNFNFKNLLVDLFYIPFLFAGKSIFQYSFALLLPMAFFSILFLPVILISKKKELYMMLIFYLFLNLFYYFVSNKDIFIFKFWNPLYFKFYTPFLFACIALLLTRIHKFFIFFSIISILLSQTNSSLIPFAKNYLDSFKAENYRNYYVFSDYYLKNTYSKIKDIVGDRRVLSLWNADPMVAVMNDIKVIDGEHNLYPISYKKKFYEIIREELQQNSLFQNYYLNWGHRVYAFVDDPKNVRINFVEAKKLGADFVISKYPLNKNELNEIIKISNKENIYLYKIN